MARMHCKTLNFQRESPMNIQRIFPLAALAVLLAGFMLTGCEDDGYCVAQWLFASDDDDDGGGSRQSAAFPDASGFWSGRAGTWQTSTKLHLSQSGSSLSGSWTWGAGDTRSCRGSINGNSIILKDTRSDGDTWHLSMSSDGLHLTGTGFKYSGGTYNVSFSR